jgi:flagellar biogenesis protein FliO
MMARDWRAARTLVVATILCGQAGPVLAQKLGQGGGDEISIWRVLGSLVVCLGLAIGAAYALRTRFRGGVPPVFGAQERRLKLVETVRLSHQADVCLMRCDEGDFIVASTPQGLIVISKPGETVKPGPQPQPQSGADA